METIYLSLSVQVAVGTFSWNLQYVKYLLFFFQVHESEVSVCPGDIQQQPALQGGGAPGPRDFCPGSLIPSTDPVSRDWWLTQSHHVMSDIVKTNIFDCS